MAKAKVSVLKATISAQNVGYFFREIKPFLVVSFILGIFPVQNCVGDICREMRFKFFSLPNILSLVGNILIVKCSELLRVEDRKHVSYYRRWELVIRLEYIMWLCLLHTVYNKVVSRIHQIQKFDAEFSKVKPASTNNQFVLIYLVSCINLFIVSYSFYLNVQNEDVFSYYLANLIYFYMLNVRFWVFLPFIASATAITRRFHRISEELEALFKRGLSCHQTLGEVRMLRGRHLQLSLLTASFTDCYSLLLTVYFVLAYFDVLMKITSLNNSPGSFDMLFDPPLFLNILVSSYAVISAADEVKQASRSVLRLVRDYPLADKPDEFYTEITQFVLQICTSTAEITAGKFFHIKKKSIPTIVGSTASCLLVLIQIVPMYFRRNKQNNSSQLKN